MPEKYYGVVEMAFSFGALIVFCLWQQRSIEKTRKRLQQEKDERGR
jgi:hypothetical protein